MPYLPQDLQRELVEQHQWLRRFGFPAVAMDHHSEWEEECYRRYCPAELIEMVERDHDAYDAGQVLSRDKVVGR